MPLPGNVEAVYFNSEAVQLIGILYVAQQEGPRPAVILLHGIPGSEKNYDIAYHLRDLGWHVLIVHFRGAWGSSGDYDMVAQPTDAQAAVDFLLNCAWNVDPARIVVVGYSLGSRAAIVAAHRDPRITAVISISGIADFDELMLSPEFYTSAAPFLHGATARSLSAQWMKLGGDENPYTLIGKLSRPMLIIHGTEDETTPYYMAPALAQAAGTNATLITIEGADHTFTQHRALLVEAVSNWLIKQFGQ